MMGTCSFTTEGLGLTPGGLLGLVQATDIDSEAASYAEWFESNWNDLRAEPGAKASFLAALEDMASQRAPSVVYFQILYQMFKDLGDELDEERINQVCDWYSGYGSLEEAFSLSARWCDRRHRQA